ncbi:sugar ABC transporter ATP-binding protein [Methylocapsa sp. S129]|uniref:sugar ABC transporter ATP-binding protein n=1 Tax=Methylocapsa sp. S129 TaxID=1641869 RepID=UPI00131E0868|nr:sugar ABC transporter ATP-binding protein [Methylocapsa sp. S129]
MQPAAVEVRNISKAFGASQVLHDVSLSIPVGVSRGLVGRNGAGKSTLVSILTGLLAPNSGKLLFDDVEAPAQRTSREWRNKVACVYQRSTLVPTMSVAENLFANAYPGNPSWVNWSRLRAAARGICEEWELGVNVDTRASDLRVEQRQLVEIARALAKGARFIIFDEPTAALESKEVARLFDRIRRLKREGVTLLYISHHLQEIYDICDSVTVLRDGRVIVAGAEVADLPKDKIVEAMVGEQIARSTRRPPVLSASSAPALSVKHLSLASMFHDISFDISPGEQVGLAGLGGSGKEQIAEAIAGLLTARSGDILVGGVTLKPGHVPTAQLTGVSYVPRDRRRRGILPQLSVAENLTVSIQRTFGNFGWIAPRRLEASARQLFSALSIVASSMRQPVVELSGGNQQKVVIGRALASSPQVLVLVYPTQGVDVAAKEAIFDIVATAQARGAAALIVSDELDELRNCQRVLVVFKGSIVKAFGADWSERDLIAAIEGVDA